MEEKKSRLRYLSVLFMLIACALFLSARLVYLYINNAEQFPISRVKITASYEHITHNDLEQVLADYIYLSFFTIPIHQLEEQLQHMAWVDYITVEREWPDTLKIKIIEKQPVAFWNNAMLTEDGKQFNVKKENNTYLLPQFVGMEGQQLTILQNYQKLSTILVNYDFHINKLELRANGAWELTLSNGIFMRLGKQDLTNRVDRFCKAYPVVVGDKDPEQLLQLTVDLRYPRGMAVHWNNKREDNG